MSWDKIIQFPGYNVNNVSISETSEVVRVHLVKSSKAPALCYKCGHELKNIHSSHWTKAEDLPILDKKTLLRFRRLKGKCSSCKKIRLESPLRRRNY